MFYLISKHWEVIRKKREGVSHPLPNHRVVTFGTREEVFYLMLHVSSVCTPCCMLLRVVESYCAKFETVQTLRYMQTDATTPNNVGSSWPTMSCPFARGFSMRSGVHSFFVFLERERRRMDVEKGRNDRLNAS